MRAPPADCKLALRLTQAPLLWMACLPRDRALTCSLFTRRPRQSRFQGGLANHRLLQITN